jgi:hypothetical protein
MLKLRELAESGPNGGTLVHLIARVSAGNSGNVAGDALENHFHPDSSGGSGSVYFHHAQIEESFSASSPIVTGWGAVTRDGDDYTIFSGGAPDWWNPNEGTILTDIIMPPNDYLIYNHIEGNPFFGCNTSSNSKIYFNYGGSNLAVVDNSLFEDRLYNRLKQGVSWSSSGRVLSGNGLSSTGSYNGDLSRPSRIKLKENIIFKKWRYIPYALSESTLNTITS